MIKNSLNRLCLMAVLAASTVGYAQNGVTQCGTDTGQPPFPLNDYQELPDPHQPNPALWAKSAAVSASWGNSYTRYAKHEVPAALEKQVTLTGWKGESVNAQAVVWGKQPIKGLAYRLSSFRNGSHTLDAQAFETGFVRYVMTDELNKGGQGGCGHRPDHSLYDSTLVADVIDSRCTKLDLPAMTAQGIWITCRIPRDAASGTYKGVLEIETEGGTLKRLPLQIKVTGRTLPEENIFHLDLWQNPYAVARYHGVEPWSDAHLEAMRPLMTRLAQAGQKVITASIMHKPWAGQTEDYFESMVTWTKKLDGSWNFDFAVFDRWVEFMMSCGIRSQINCYSMIPWALSFQYFDQASNRMQFIKAAPGEDTYSEVWTAMLKSFAAHLRSKGWFDICTIAMDERSMEDMQRTFRVIREADPAFKVSLAGNYHPEIETDLYDYCIAFGQKFPEEVLARRQKDGLKSTYYTCCTEARPNTFTFSPPAEATWIGYYTATQHVDGYLRWAYNSWVKEPLLDTRFRSWAGGDTYIVYPGNRSSIRFEKLVEGIQAFQKIDVLRKAYMQQGKKSALKKLDEALQRFTPKQLLNEKETLRTIKQAQDLLNQ